MTPRRAFATAGVLALLILLAACGGDDGPAGDRQTLTVLAAASLTDVYEDLGETFEEEHGVEVEFSFGSSTDLAVQAADGAPGDVLSTADETSMQIAEDAGVAGEVVTFATNVLVIVTPPENPAGVTSLDDLTGATWVRCADEVPCGRVALAVLEANAITAEPASLEEDVRATLDKVTSGEAEAGLVYASDAVAAGDDVATSEIPGSEEQRTSYLSAPLEGAEDADLAHAWLDLLASGPGQQALTDAGFSPPVTRDPLGRPPALLMVPAALAVLLLVVPLAAMVAATDLPGLPEQLRSEPAREALWLSVLTSTVAVVFCLVLGLPLAWVLARLEFRGRTLLRALVTVPLVLPPVVAGVALRTAFGRTGVIGEPLLELTGFAFPFTTWGVVLAHVFVSLPFVVISIEGAFRSADPEYDAAAATLGASRWTAFRRVTVPLALPGITAGLVLGWARSLGEFGATITFNGNYPGVTQTMPNLIYVTRQSDQDAALALSLVMLVLSVAILLVLRDRWLGTPGART